MLSVETEYVWRTTAGNGGVLGVDGVDDDDVRARVRLLGRLTVAGVRRRVGVLKRPDSACMVRRGVASLLVVLSVDIPEPLGNDVKVPSKKLGEELRRVGQWIVSFKSISRKEWLTLVSFSFVSRSHAFPKHRSEVRVEADPSLPYPAPRVAPRLGQPRNLLLLLGEHWVP